MAAKLRRKTPDELLQEVQAEEAAATKTGHLKIVLGYAAGAGKTFRLLDEARRRKERGQDVVIGAVQREVQAEIVPLLRKLEIIPLKQLSGGMTLDVDTLIHRHPMVCFIDGLAYDNPPGARNSTRWQDVQDLLTAGIKVVASINVQYIEELQDQIETITGKRKQETVPITFLESASEIEIVDIPPEDPIELSAEQQSAAQKREQRLSRLRELALILAADVVDHQLNTYLECHGIHQQFGAHERILVWVTHDGDLQKMLDEARIVTDKFHGELIVAYVNQPSLSTTDRSALQEKLASAHAAGITVEVLEGHDAAVTLLDFARARGVTQLFVSQCQPKGLARLRRSPLDTLIWQGHGMDVHVFPQPNG